MSSPRKRTARSRPFLFYALLVIVVVLVGGPLLMVINRALPAIGIGESSSGTSAIQGSLLTVIWNTVVFAAGCVLVGLLGGLSLAFVVARTDAPGIRTIGKFLPIASLLMPPMIGTLGWVVLGAPRVGIFNVIARRLFGLSPETTWFNVYSMYGLILVGGLYLIPYTYLYITPALQSIPGELEEASLMSGATKLHTLRRIVLPVLKPTILSTCLVLVMLAIAEFSTPLILGTPLDFEVLTLRMWRMVNVSYPPDRSGAALLGTLLLVPAMIMLYLQRRLVAHQERYEVVGTRGRRSDKIRLGAWRWPVALGLWAYVALAVVVPILGLLYLSFQGYWSGNLRFDGLSLQNYDWLFASSTGMTSIRNSLTLGVVAASVSVLLSFLIGFVTIRMRFRGRALLEYIALIPLSLPNAVLGLGFLLFFLALPNWLNLYGSKWGLAIAYIVVFTPFSLKAVSGGLYQVSTNLEEAARVHGASWATTLRTITLRLLLGFLTSGWMIVFVLSFRELPVSAMLAPTGSDSVTATFLIDTWSNQLFPRTASYAIVLMAINLLVVGVLFGVQERSSRRWSNG